MPKFNFLAGTAIKHPTSQKNKNEHSVRTRAIGRDRYAGLKGMAYINARAAEKLRRTGNE